MASGLKIRRLPSRNPDPSTAKAHHIGSPPSAFHNPWPSFKSHSAFELLKARFGNNPEKNYVPVPQGPNGERSDELVKVLTPDWGVQHRDKMRATWIGHASFFVEMPVTTGAVRGVRILLDPVFSERTSPVNFAGPKRYTPVPTALEEMPDVDLVLISHNHYDHLDFYVISTLYSKLKGRLHFFVGLNTKYWFLQQIGCTDADVTELDWWDGCDVDVTDVGSVRLTSTPAQHFSKRSITDGGHSLWCSWTIEGNGKKLFFAGDTAYQAKDTPSPCPAFKQIGETLGPFDLALIPIGLYSPPHLAAAVHVHPEQSLKIHKDVRSKLSIGMHYGTVRGGLSGVFEPVTDPPRRWKAAAEKEDLWAGGGVEGDGSPVDIRKEYGVGLCHVGETVSV